MKQYPALTLPLTREGIFFVGENLPQHPIVTLQLLAIIFVGWVLTQQINRLVQVGFYAVND